MGLDMYAWRVKAEDAIDDFTIAKDEEGQSKVEEMHYWRKHHNLHGWMERLYYAKGGEADSFNCVPVRLNEVDLLALELDIKSRKLPDTTGFFFGDNPPDEDSDQQDLKFIVQCRDAIAEGDAVYYDSWW
jgi:hypothetical protein